MIQLVREPATVAPDRQPRNVGRWLVVTLVVLLVALTYGLVEYGFRYAPLQASGFGGPQPGSPDLGPLVAGARSIGGPTGTRATLLFGLDSTGSLGVTIDRIATDDVVVAAGWAPYRAGPDGLVSGTALPPEPFPARLAGHGRLQLLLTVRQPDCAAHRNSSRTVGSVTGALACGRRQPHHGPPADGRPALPAAVRAVLIAITAPAPGFPALGMR